MGTKIHARAGMQIGLYTFGDVVNNPQTEQTISTQQRLQEVLAAAKFADEAGLDVFGVGEHHRLGYSISAPSVVLAAIAQITQHIRLTSAATILSTSDPVRVFKDFATIDLLSNGRVEIIAGRGASAEPFSLFGYDPSDSNRLFLEKLELLLQINTQERVTWQGLFRPALYNAEIVPRPIQKQLPIWIGVGGTLESAANAGMQRLPMMIGIIGGTPVRLRLLVELYRQSAMQAGQDLSTLKIGITSHFYIRKQSQQALHEFYPHYLHYFRTFLPAYQISRSDYDQLAGPRGTLFVGSPQQIIDKLLYQHEQFGHQRFLAQFDIGGLPYPKIAESIELLATEVAPVVRHETSGTLNNN